ncbi:MAG: sialate O-acetylesterase [Clostridiaceae bacterium]|nr:sialate O-acetylesterase [Clostridiaceae bacterium]
MAKLLWLPSFYASGMILQQQVPFHLHGQAEPGCEVRIQLERVPFDGRSYSPLDSQYGLLLDEKTTCDEQGRFSLDLPAFDASFDPFTLTIKSGKTNIVFQDVLFGEVWVAAGQSNMHMPVAAVHGAEQIHALANLFYVRVLKQSETGLGKENPHYGFAPLDDLQDSRWLRGDQPEAMEQVSAIGFSFAREVHLELRIPVGLIETALGGTYIHSWISRPSIDSQELLRRHVQDIGFYREEKDWDLSASWETAQHQPAALYNNKVAPLRGLAARGILWYQGESDYQYPEYYQTALQTLVRDWNQIFQPADKRGLGFLYIQLAPYFYGHRRFEQLAEFNEMLAAVRHNLLGPAALVPIYDLPLTYVDAPADWRHPIHPSVKLPIGQRLKTIAMGLLYQRKGPLTAPECSDIEVVGNKMLLSFSNIGEGLRLTGDDTRLRGFALCGPDRIFHEAQARILYGVRVLVWHEQIADPCAVTYAYADMNQTANLISRDQLPVVPFRSDKAPSRYWPPMEWLHCEALQIWCCPKMDKPEETGWHPAWRLERGRGELSLEKANKSEGDGALLLRYSTKESHEVAVEPVLDYDSLFPPLDLSPYASLSIDIFNTDQQIKYLRLALASGSADAGLQILPERLTILPVLRWQKFNFKLQAASGGLEAVRRLVFIIEDKKDKGVLYLDQINLICPE